MSTLSKEDLYATENAAGREAARIILEKVRADPDTLPKLVRSIREAVHDGNNGHGIGFLFAVAQAAIRGGA